MLFYSFILSFYECRSDIAEQSGELVSRSVTGSMISRCSWFLVLLFLYIYIPLYNATCLCLSINRDNFGYADAHMDRHMVPRQMPAATGPADWREALDIVALGLPEQVMILFIFHSSFYMMCSGIMILNPSEYIFAFVY